MMINDIERFMGVILAAGLGRRAGVLKPAIEVAGKPLLGHAVDGLRQRCRQVVVVVGHEAGQVAQLVAGRPDVVTVINPDYQEDMLRSVQAGVAVLPDDLDGFFILPVDCPQVCPEVLDAMLEEFRLHSRRRPIVPEHEGRGGHPVLLPRSADSMILAARPPANLRTLLNDLSARRVEVPSDTIHLDLDTPEILASWRQSLIDRQDRH